MARQKSDGSEEKTVKVFGALANQTRLNLFRLLLNGETNVTELCAKVSLSQPLVSNHLSTLRLVGLINSRREGQKVFYSADAGLLKEVTSGLI